VELPAGSINCSSVSHIRASSTRSALIWGWKEDAAPGVLPTGLCPLGGRWSPPRSSKLGGFQPSSQQVRFEGIRIPEPRD
jgi:hypothetical protein